MEEFNEENSILSHDYRSLYLDPNLINTQIFSNLSTKDSVIQDDNINNDIIPFKTKIIYSIPSFGKMSCLVLLK